MSDKNPNTGWLQQSKRMVIVVAVATVIVAGGAFAVQAFANSQTYKHMQLAASYKSAWRGGKDGGGHQSFSKLSDAEIDARIERIVKHVAIEIDATSAQQQQITALVSAAAKDLKPVHLRMRTVGKEIRDLLTADTVDRAALEKLRSARLAEAEKISKDLVEVMADVADVLSLKQRKKLDETIQQFRGMRRGWHRG